MENAISKSNTGGTTRRESRDPSHTPSGPSLSKDEPHWHATGRYHTEFGRTESQVHLRREKSDQSDAGVGDGTSSSETMRSCYGGSSTYTSRLESASQHCHPLSADITQPQDEALKGVGAWSSATGCNMAEVPLRISYGSAPASKSTNARTAVVGDQKTRIEDEQLSHVRSYLKTPMDLDSLFKP